MMTDDAQRWNARYQGLEATDGSGAELRFEPPGALRRLGRFLPESGIAIDLAGGNGGGALWLAERGLQPILVDVSDVAITQAHAAANARSLRIGSACRDIAGGVLAGLLDEVVVATRELPTAHALPTAYALTTPAAVRLVSCFHYLDRELLMSIAAGLPPGATFMAAIATVTNQERNSRPSARFLLEPGELRELVAGEDALSGGLEVLHSHEGWNDGDHHEAELVVRRPLP